MNVARQRRPAAQPEAPHKWRARVAWPLTLLLLLGAAHGCSSPQRRYKVLSFFFDGVPTPEDREVARSETGDGPGLADPAQISDAGLVEADPGWDTDPSKEPRYDHDPFLRRECDSCHEQPGFSFSGSGPEICAECHDRAELTRESACVAVVDGECLRCHAPMNSPYQHLLRDGARDLCRACHDDKSEGAIHCPSKLLAGRPCLMCHLAHGKAGTDQGDEPAGDDPEAGVEGDDPLEGDP